ncbi:MAG: hypothetical protein LPK38_06675 [Actinomycetes bacterium]|nr:hypothetical protein [Actinomycetes bacterium]MDX5400096.1 hypothetical protein [Actinomycetes bacterium]MDX5450725.1 hypothetical protein [Actinomycetes bacterium]
MPDVTEVAVETALREASQAARNGEWGRVRDLMEQAREAVPSPRRFGQGWAPDPVRVRTWPFSIVVVSASDRRYGASDVPVISLGDVDLTPDQAEELASVLLRFVSIARGGEE